MGDQSSSFDSRKLSPPMLAILGESSRCRSGSDPSISKQGFDSCKTPLSASISIDKKQSRNYSTETSFSSPKSSKLMKRLFNMKVSNSIFDFCSIDVFLTILYWNKKEKKRRIKQDHKIIAHSDKKPKLEMLRLEVILTSNLTRMNVNSFQDRE